MAKKKRSWPPVPAPLPVAVIDNHTHLPLHEGEIPNPGGQRLSLDEQLANARMANVGAVITSGCELPDLAPTLALAQTYAQVWAALAIHPNEAALHAGVTAPGPDGGSPRLGDHHETSLDEAIAAVAELAADPACVAVGETGLDYFRTAPAGRAAQAESFKAHIALAKELDLPLQIHDRDAHADTIAILQAVGAPQRTVFHCFSGDAQMAQILAENGWYASFAGPITYPANEYLRSALAQLPRELVLVETDAPYLTPAPHRGNPNASYVLPHTVAYIADMWGMDLAASCQQLTTNTTTVYSITPEANAA